LLSGAEWRGVALDGGMITAAALAAFLYGLGRYGPSPRARTIAFTTLTSAQLLYALSARSESPLSLFGKGRLRRNPWLLRTVVVSLGLQAATTAFPPLRALLRTTPIGLADLAVVGTLALTPTLAREALKRLHVRPAPAPLGAAAVPAPAAVKRAPRVRSKAVPRKAGTRRPRR
jgi:Ca2+-transporting ATPase